MSIDPVRLKNVFSEALALTDPAERDAYLAAECAGDIAFRVRLEALLRASAEPDSLLDHPPSHPAIGAASRGDATTDLHPVEPGTGAYLPEEDTGTFGSTSRTQHIAHTLGNVIAGRYTLVKVIGEGGMGSVYLANQTEPVKRDVALKLIKAGMDSKAVLARFDAERQALALMDHPNIARVYDGGTTSSGQPFFVMELVRGIPLTEYSDQKRLSVTARLELFVLVCNAVQHAHQKGIIHRDLKPGNVLVTEMEGRPTPKVIDFGVAKATEFKLTDLSFADAGAIVGTPTYMSPEQADPSSMDIDTRTDVYALGVMLYELLVGSPPLEMRQLQRGAILEMLRMVREVEPPRPSSKLSTADNLPNIAANRNIEPAKLAKSLRGELDWVVMKALEKDRTRRYDTANGLARDVQRHLMDEVVEARPPSRGYRLKKFVRRHKGQVLAATLILLCLVGGLGASLWQMDRAVTAEGQSTTNAEEARTNERRAIANAQQAVTERDAKAKALEAEALQTRKAEAALLQAENNLSLQRILQAEQHWQNGNLIETSRLLQACPLAFRQWEWHYLNRLRGAGGSRRVYEGPVTTLRVGTDHRLLTATEYVPDPSAKVWNMDPDGEMELLAHVRTAAHGAALSPAGDLIAVGSITGGVELWSAPTGKLIKKMGVLKGRAGSLDFSPDGKLLAAGSRLGFAHAGPSGFTVWEVETGKVVTDVADAGAIVRFLKEGTRLIADKGNSLRLWDTGTWKEVAVIPGGLASLEVRPSLDASKNGELVAVSGSTAIGDTAGPCMRLLDTTEGKELSRIQVPDTLQGLAISPDGKRLAAGSGPFGTAVVVWEVKSGREIARFRGHAGRVASVAFSRNGKTIYSVDEEGILKTWKDYEYRYTATRAENTSELTFSHAVAIDAGATRAAIADQSIFAEPGDLSDIIVWNPASGKTLKKIKGHRGLINSLAFSTVGNRLVSAGDDKTIEVWDLGSPTKSLRKYTGHSSGVSQALPGPDGSWVVSSENAKPEVRVWDVETGLDRHVFRGHIDPIHQLGVSPNGKRVASTSVFDLKVWNPADGSIVCSHKLSSGESTALEFSPAGDLLVVTTYQRVTCLNAETGEVLYSHQSNELNERAAVTFTPDGGRMITASNGVVRLWEARTGQEVLTMIGGKPLPLFAAAATDGRFLRIVLRDGRVNSWDGSPSRPVDK